MCPGCGIQNCDVWEYSRGDWLVRGQRYRTGLRDGTEQPDSGKGEKRGQWNVKVW